MKAQGDYSFEADLARELARAFSATAGLGCCVITAPQGETLCSFGYTCRQCALCQARGPDEAACAGAHLYGMKEAERFGGRFVYFCKRGMTFFVSPIIGRGRGEARVTAGPFLMVEAADFLACELGGAQEYAPLVKQIPFVAPQRVTELSTLLFMAVGFLNNVATAEAMREREAKDAVQGQISAYILEVKQEKNAAEYPYDKERALLGAMAEGDRPRANRLLNELLGHILLASGASFSRVKAYINALLVMMTREAAWRGGGAAALNQLTVEGFVRLQEMKDMPSLCRWLTVTMNELMASAFEYRDARHADAIHRCMQYVRTHLSQKLEAEELARTACLSQAYFSRVFKEETGRTVGQFVMEARLQRAAELMRYDTLKLAEIAASVGFQDQSYFSRAFQRAYGVSPKEYRKAKWQS